MNLSRVEMKWELLSVRIDGRTEGGYGDDANTNGGWKFIFKWNGITIL